MNYYLLYSSKASYLFMKGDLPRILTTSRSNNTARKVTGILLFYNNNFIQVLEGDELVVKQIFEVISNDKRHNGVTKLLEGFSADRQFPDWAMGFREIGGDEYTKLNGELELSNDSVFNRASISSPISVLLKRYLPSSR